jgi:aspartate/methionine/tyrosine aminotransferase
MKNSGSSACDETGVAATPGVDFDPGEGWHNLRFSFAGSQEDCREALRRLKGWHYPRS